MSNWIIKIPAEQLEKEEINLLIAYKKLRKGNCINWCKQITEDNEAQYIYEIKTVEETKSKATEQILDPEDQETENKYHSSKKSRSMHSTKPSLNEPNHRHSRNDYSKGPENIDDEESPHMLGVKRKPLPQLAPKNQAYQYIQPQPRSRHPEPPLDAKSYTYEKQGKRKQPTQPERPQTRGLSLSNPSLGQFGLQLPRNMRDDIYYPGPQPGLDNSRYGRNPLELGMRRAPSQSTRIKDPLVPNYPAPRPREDWRTAKPVRLPIMKSQTPAPEVEDISNSSSVQDGEQSSSLPYESTKPAAAAVSSRSQAPPRSLPTKRIKPASTSESDPDQTDQNSAPVIVIPKSPVAKHTQAVAVPTPTAQEVPPAWATLPFPQLLSKATLAELAKSPEVFRCVMEQLLAVHILFGVDMEVAAKRWLLLQDRDLMLRELLEEFTTDDVAVLVL